MHRAFTHISTLLMFSGSFIKDMPHNWNPKWKVRAGMTHARIDFVCVSLQRRTQRKLSHARLSTWGKTDRIHFG